MSTTNPFPILENKTIIVTQSCPSNEGLLQQLRFCQANPIPLPCSTITPKKLSPFSVQTAHQADCWVFQSSNAARSCFPALSESSSDKTIISIGPSTQQTLSDFGIHVDLIPEKHYDSNGISQLPYFHDQPGRNVIVFGGKQSHTNLEKDLRSLGHACKKITTHHYSLTPLPQIQETLSGLPQKIDAITSHSLTNLQHLTQLAALQPSTWLAQTPLLVISEKMADYAQQKKLTPTILQAESPVSNMVLHRLSQWFTEQGSIHEQ